MGWKTKLDSLIYKVDDGLSLVLSLGHMLSDWGKYTEHGGLIVGAFFNI